MLKMQNGCGCKMRPDVPASLAGERKGAGSPHPRGPARRGGPSAGASQLAG